MGRTPFAARGGARLAILAMALGAGACASARVGPEGAERPSVIVRPAALLLEGMAANHALVVTRADLDAAIGPLFADADSDHDGLISPVEFAAWAEKYMGTTDAAPGRLSFDVKQDGKITREEFAAGLLALFNRYDKTHEGRITRQEFIDRFELRSPDPAHPGAQDQPGGRGGRGGGLRGEGN